MLILPMKDLILQPGTDNFYYYSKENFRKYLNSEFALPYWDWERDDGRSIYLIMIYWVTLTYMVKVTPKCMTDI